MDRGSDHSNAGHGMERRVGKKIEDQVLNKSVKRALQLMEKALQLLKDEGATRKIIGPKIKRPFQRPLPGNTCNFCHKPGHFKRDCWMAKGLCLRCGSGRHMIRNCPHRKVGYVGPARPVRPAPPPRRNPEPVPPQQDDQQQRGVESGADQSRAEASGSAAERVDQCSDPKP